MKSCDFQTVEDGDAVAPVMRAIFQTKGANIIWAISPMLLDQENVADSIEPIVEER